MSQEMIRLAGRAAPQLMTETARMLSILEQTSPEFVPDVLADFEKISSVAAEKSKTADVSDVSPGMLSTGVSVMGWGKSMGGNLATGVVAGMGAAVASDLYNAVRKGLFKKRNWERMISSNPELKERGLGEVRKHFNTLQQTAPALAANPIAAGAAVTQLLDIPSNRYHQILTELAEDQKKIVDAQYRLNVSGGGGGGGGGGKGKG